MRSGNVNLNNGYLRNAGRNGEYWSSTASSETAKAYEFYFNVSGVNPSNSNNRYNGRSVRCLAAVLRAAVPIFSFISLILGLRRKIA